MAKEKQSEGKVSVKLIRTHRHEGKRQAAGTPINVRKSLLPKLKAWGVIDENAGTTGSASTGTSAGTSTQQGA